MKRDAGKQKSDILSSKQLEGVGRGGDERCSRRARLEIRANSYLCCHLGRSLKTMEADRGRTGGRDGSRPLHRLTPLPNLQLSETNWKELEEAVR